MATYQVFDPLIGDLIKGIKELRGTIQIDAVMPAAAVVMIISTVHK